MPKPKESAPIRWGVELLTKPATRNDPAVPPRAPDPPSFGHSFPIEDEGPAYDAGSPGQRGAPLEPELPMGGRMRRPNPHIVPASGGPGIGASGPMRPPAIEAAPGMAPPFGGPPGIEDHPMMAAPGMRAQPGPGPMAPSAPMEPMGRQMGPPGAGPYAAEDQMMPPGHPGSMAGNPNAPYELEMPVPSAMGDDYVPPHASPPV